MIYPNFLKTFQAAPKVTKNQYPYEFDNCILKIWIPFWYFLNLLQNKKP